MVRRSCEKAAFDQGCTRVLGAVGKQDNCHVALDPFLCRVLFELAPWLSAPLDREWVTVRARRRRSQTTKKTARPGRQLLLIIWAMRWASARRGPDGPPLRHRYGSACGYSVRPDYVASTCQMLSVRGPGRTGVAESWSGKRTPSKTAIAP